MMMQNSKHNITEIIHWFFVIFICAEIYRLYKIYKWTQYDYIE
jgi:hypothetical protein